MSPTRNELLRALPAVDRLLAVPELAALAGRASRAELVAAARAALDALRGRIARGEAEEAELGEGAVARRVAAELARRDRPWYRLVINATGVVLHTNLGRAPLAPEAVAALAATAGGAQRLEVDLATGRRGGREEGCAALLRELTGAEAATVVNNNAAATLLALAALARGRRVVLSRGEMVEIGGSFRVPEILRESGAELVEVGTTNRTHPRDYRRALAAGDAAAGLILKVHASNYRIVGFTGEVGIEELVALGREHGVPVVHDLGSGCLVDLEAWDLPPEPLVRRSVEAGADLVCFSGDKLLGGPQAGILVGRAEAVERCRSHPLYRALRPGRLVYTALEATLKLYRGGEREALARVPALAALAAGPAELERRAARLAEAIAVRAGMRAEVVRTVSEAGSGSLPARQLESRAVRLLPDGGSAEALAAALRRGEPPVIARIHQGAVLLDVRTLAEGDSPECGGGEGDEIAAIAARLAELAAAPEAPAKKDSG